MGRTPVWQELALLEVSLLVAAAVERADAVSARRYAAFVSDRHPTCDMTEQEISELVKQLAAKRGLAVDY